MKDRKRFELANDFARVLLRREDVRENHSISTAFFGTTMLRICLPMGPETFGDSNVLGTVEVQTVPLRFMSRNSRNELRSALRQLDEYRVYVFIVYSTGASPMAGIFPWEASPWMEIHQQALRFEYTLKLSISDGPGGNLCGRCGTESEGELLCCDACHRVKYCNAECQRKDSRVHTPHCKVLQKLPAPPN